VIIAVINFASAAKKSTVVAIVAVIAVAIFIN